MGETKKPCHNEIVVFNFALFFYVCFETLEVGFGLYLTNKVITGET